MTYPSDFETFCSDIQDLPEVYAVLNGVAEDAEIDEATNGKRCFDPTSAALSLIATAALWKLVCVGITTLRGMTENALLGQRVQLIRELRDMGYERQAPYIVDRLLKDMRDRPEDDPVLKKIAELHGR